MNANSKTQAGRQTAFTQGMVPVQNAHIFIVPTTAAHAEAMDALSALIYQHPTGIRVEEFRSQVRHFPEGQFVAIDADCGQVVGYTSSMRVQFDPAQPIFEPWEKATGYG